MRTGEAVPDLEVAEGAFDEWLVSRMRVMGAFSETDFAALLGVYFAGREKLHHLFRIEFTNTGIVAMPKGGATANLPPARFPVRTCLSRIALELVGKSLEPGR